MTRPDFPPSLWRIAVIVLIVVDVVLVAVVLGIGSRPAATSPATTALIRSTFTPSPGQTPDPSDSPSPSPSPTPSTSDSPSPTPSTSPSPGAGTVVPVKRLLVAVDRRHAWRVSVGSCTGGATATVSVSTDAGASWTAARSPLASISRLVVRPSSAAVFAVGADDHCDAKLRRTDDEGASWTATEGLLGFFAVDPHDPGSVTVRGRGTVEACGGRPVVDLTVDGGDLVVLCPDGRLRTIGDGDTTWTDGPHIAGAVALGTSRAEPTRTYVARLGRSSCAGVEIVDASKAGDPVACVPRTDPVSPGTVSLSIAGGAGWLLVGSDVYTSGNTLADWTRR